MPSYIVTDYAPPKVAGRHAVAGDALELTEAQALYELTAGHIRPEQSEEKSAPVAAETDGNAAVKSGSKRR
jgi:hypothetical protein